MVLVYFVYLVALALWAAGFSDGGTDNFVRHTSFLHGKKHFLHGKKRGVGGEEEGACTHMKKKLTDQAARLDHAAQLPDRLTFLFPSTSCN